MRADRRAGAGVAARRSRPRTFRIDSAYYQLELLERLRRERARFTVSVPRSQAMWKALGEIGEDAWQDALQMEGAQVAETRYRPEGWKHEPLRLIVRRVHVHRRGDRQAQGLPTAEDDPSRPAAAGARRADRLRLWLQLHPHRYPLAAHLWIEHFHRHRAQIEERLKESKLGQALRHLPSGDEHANRVWLTAALLALNLTAFCCDLCPAAGASGKAPDNAPLAAPPRRFATSSSTSPRGSCAPAGG